MKILVVKLHALGDMVIATPALTRLREGMPDAKIDLLTTDWTAPAVQNNPCVDCIIIVKDRLFFRPQLRSSIRLLNLIKSLRGRDYDSAVVFHSHPVIIRFVKFSVASSVYHFGAENSDFTVRLDEGRHSALTAWELAELAVSGATTKVRGEIDLQDLTYEWHVNDDERSNAKEILRKFGLVEREFIIVAPGGGVNPRTRTMESVRRWGSAKFGKLTVELKWDYNMPIVLIGGQSDRTVCLDVNRYSGNVALDFSGMFDIRTTAAIIRESRLTVTNDSGPLHVAAAVKTPVVGVFGPTGSDLKLPPGNYSYAVSVGLPCSPCFFSRFRGCIFESIRCMDELTVDRVMYVVDQALQATGMEVAQ